MAGQPAKRAPVKAGFRGFDAPGNERLVAIPGREFAKPRGFHFNQDGFLKTAIENYRGSGQAHCQGYSRAFSGRK